jgi:hypothetical protein
MKTHAIIPDCQVKEGVPIDHLLWAGSYIASKHPDVIVNLGDFADMPSLSSYDVGKKSFEGRRYTKDIDAAHKAMQLFLSPIRQEQARLKRNKEKSWNPRMIMVLGNHENRINKAINNDSKLEGLISVKDLGYEDYGWEVIPYLEPIVVDGVAYCLEENHKVLTKDLQYVKLKNIQVGDELLAFEEDNQESNCGRKYKTSIVTKKRITPAAVYKVVLSNGKVFTVTSDHRWLVRNTRGGTGWKHTHELKPSDIIPRYFDEWETVNTKDAGYLAGIFDGEGYISKPNTKQGGIQIGFGQNDGLVLNKSLDIIKKLNFKTLEYYSRDCRQIKIGGTSADKIKFLGSIRPIRLIEKFKPEMLGRMQTIENSYVASVTYQEEAANIVEIETTTSTLIVDGYAHHNCHYFVSGVLGRAVTSARMLLTKHHMSCVAGHQQGRDIAYSQRADGKRMTGIISGSFYQHDEEYLTAQNNEHWRGIWFAHEVSDGAFDEMPLSMEYLKSKYTRSVN